MKFFKTNQNIKTVVGPFMDATTGIVPRVALTASCVEGVIFWELDDASVHAPKQFTCTASSDKPNALVLCTGSMGFYELDIQATNVNTKGRITLALRVSSTNAGYCVPVWHEGFVAAGDMYDTFYTGTTAGTAFKKFFDVASPTGTINSIPDAVAGAVNGLVIAGSNSAITFSNLTVTTAATFGTVAVTATMSVARYTAASEAITTATYTGLTVTTALSVGALVATSMSCGIISTPMWSVTSAEIGDLAVGTAAVTATISMGKMVVAGSANINGLAITTSFAVGTTMTVGKINTPILAAGSADFTGVAITTSFAVGTTATIGSVNCGAFTVTSLNATGVSVTTAITVGTTVSAARISTPIFFAASADFTGVSITTSFAVGTTMTVGKVNTPNLTVASANFTGVAVTTAFSVGGFIATTVSIAGTIAVDGTAIFHGIDTTAISITTMSAGKFHVGTFVDCLERAYQILNNKMEIITSSGATTLRNVGDTADLATTTVTDAAGVTTRDELTW
jgi:hypothetical protein